MNIEKTPTDGRVRRNAPPPPPLPAPRRSPKLTGGAKTAGPTLRGPGAEIPKPPVVPAAAPAPSRERATVTYLPVQGSRLTPTAAQAVGERLSRLLDRNGGAPLTPAQVLADARKPTSPLHTHFEWDNNAAAEAYRLDQARHLLRSVKVVFTDQRTGEESIAVRAFLIPPTAAQAGEEDDDDGADADESGYVRSVTLLSDAEMRRRLVLRALRELEAWRSRHQALVELAAVFDALDTVAAAVQPAAAQKSTATVRMRAPQVTRRRAQASSAGTVQ